MVGDPAPQGPQGPPQLVLAQGCVSAGEKHLCIVRKVQVKVTLDIKGFSVTASCNIFVLHQCLKRSVQSLLFLSKISSHKVTLITGAA